MRKGFTLPRFAGHPAGDLGNKENSMLNRHPSIVRALVLVLASLGGSPSWAQDVYDLRPVEITGRTVRMDVRDTCPDIQQSLSESLASAYHQIGREASYTVGFTLDQRKVGDVRSQGIHNDYRNAIRRAVSRLDCQDSRAASTPQHFAFRLDIRHEADRQGGLAALRPPTLAELRGY